MAEEGERTSVLLFPEAEAPAAFLLPTALRDVHSQRPVSQELAERDAEGRDCLLLPDPSLLQQAAVPTPGPG